MIKVYFNALGMPIFSCSHVKGRRNCKDKHVTDDRTKNICNKCERKVADKLNKIFNEK